MFYDFLYYILTWTMRKIFNSPIYFILFLSLVIELDTSGFTILTHIVHEPFVLDPGGYMLYSLILFSFIFIIIFSSMHLLQRSVFL
jgi:hypothetical protein